MPQIGPTSFSLMSDLSNQVGVDGIVVTVNGKVSMNDGWQSTYMWNSSSTATADGFNVIQVTGVSTGRWVRAMIAINIVSAAATLDLGNITSYYTFTGTTATWKLPTVLSSIGARLIFINQGSGTLTVNSNTGANDIDDSGISVNTIAMAPGEHYIFYNNSLKFTSLQ